MVPVTLLFEAFCNGLYDWLNNGLTNSETVV